VRQPISNARNLIPWASLPRPLSILLHARSFRCNDHARRRPDQKASALFAQLGHRRVNPGWPIDVEATVSYNGVDFTAEFQQQRPALGMWRYSLCRIWEYDRLPSISWLARRIPIDDPSSGQLGPRPPAPTLVAAQYGARAASLATVRTHSSRRGTPLERWQLGRRRSGDSLPARTDFSGSPADFLGA